MTSYVVRANPNHQAWNRLEELSDALHGHRTEDNIKFQLIECEPDEVNALEQEGFIVEVAPNGAYLWSSEHFLVADGGVPYAPDSFKGDYQSAEQAVHDSKPGTLLCSAPLFGYSVFPANTIPYSIVDGKTVNWPRMPAAHIPDFDQLVNKEPATSDEEERNHLKNQLITAWLNQTLYREEEEAAKDDDFHNRPWS